MAVYLRIKDENGEEISILYDDWVKLNEKEEQDLLKSGAEEQIFEIWYAELEKGKFVCSKVSEEKALTFYRAVKKYESKSRRLGDYSPSEFDSKINFTGGYYSSEEAAKQAFEE